MLTGADEKIRTSDLPNPRGQRDGGDYGFEHASVPIPKVSGWAHVLRQLKGLAVQDNRSFAWLLRSALLEYYDNHWPGNPVPRIENYMPGGLPFSEAAKMKLSRNQRDLPAGIKILPPGVKIEPCEDCQGSGKGPAGDSCRHCGGHGTIQVEKAR
jgi:hypothetical protein